MTVITIQPRNSGERDLWPAWQDGEMISSVVDLDDAIRRASKANADLHVQRPAYDEMVAAGKAPKEHPSRVAVIDPPP